MYKHSVIPSFGNANYDERFQDYVFVTFSYFYVTVEEVDGVIRRATTLHSINLPEPIVENYILAKDVLPEVRKQWLESLIEPILPQLQQENINKLQ